MEYWSVEKRHQSFSHYSNTPVLQCSKLIVIECCYDGLPRFAFYSNDSTTVKE